MGDTLYLEPRLGPSLGALLQNPGLLHSLVDGLGSPLGVVLPEQIEANVRAFRAVYRRHHLSGRICYAHKANRSSALVRRLAAINEEDVGVEVASLGELRHALGAGLAGARITANGPKNREFLWLAARSGATVVLNSPEELEELAALVRKHRLPRVEVMPRLSEFLDGGRTPFRMSRFGIPAGTGRDALFKTLDRHGDAVELVGAAFHLDTVAVGEKSRALEVCLAFLEECRSRGLRPGGVDIGGGFGVNYLAHAAQWEHYTTQLHDAVRLARPPMTVAGHGYGLERSGNGHVSGALRVYPAYREVAGPRYLEELLAQPAAAMGGRPLAELLLEHLYDVHVEPGRALLDQCGATLAKVVEVSARGSGLWVRLAADAHDIGLEEHGVLVDPVLVPRRGAAAEPVAVTLHGNRCLESDLITRRIVHLPRRPRPGDLLAFANTAGYCMDFHATRAQRLPVARKVAAWQDGPAGGAWRWCLDEEYWPTDVEHTEHAGHTEHAEGER